MTLAEHLLHTISEDTSYIFSVPGRTIFPFLRLTKKANITDIICTSELGAGFMADGYARASNKYGVALVVSGPGFSNTFGAITNAYYDNSRVLFILGTPESYLNGKNSFQDNSSNMLNSNNIAANLASYSCTVNGVDIDHQLSNTMFYLKNHSLPVILNIPIDVQELKFNNTKCAPKIINHGYINKDAFIRIKNIMQNNSFIFVTGSRSIEVKNELSTLCEEHFIPLAYSLCSKSVISEHKDYSLGIFGFGMSHKSYQMIIEQPPEYIIAIGLDYNERNTFKWSNLPSKVIHIDSIISENSRDHSFIDEGYITNLQYLLAELTKDSELKESLAKSRVKRVTLMDNLSQNEVVTITHEDDKLYTDMVIQGISNIYNTDCNFVIDSGLHRLYCAALLKLDISCSYYSSINNAHMGWAIPASIGTKLADPKRHCICITGDGCMLMNGIKIQTAAKYNIKVLFIVLNNGAHGAIKNADMKFNKHPELDDNHYSIPNHDWDLFAKAFGMLAITINHISQLESALELFKNYPSPVLLNVECHYDNNVDINIYYDKIVSLALN